MLFNKMYSDVPSSDHCKFIKDHPLSPLQDALGLTGVDQEAVNQRHKHITNIC